MISTLVQVSEQETKELDISVFLIENLQEGLAIIVYPDSGRPKRVNVERDFNFKVENNQLEIYDKTKNDRVFTLNLENFEFIDRDEYIKFEHEYKDITIKIAPANLITEEEDKIISTINNAKMICNFGLHNGFYGTLALEEIIEMCEDYKTNIYSIEIASISDLVELVLIEEESYKGLIEVKEGIFKWMRTKKGFNKYIKIF